MNKRSWLIATTAAAMLAVTGCATTPARTPQLSTFNQLIIDAGLADSLRAGGPYTVFAPSDEAFKALPERTLADLKQNKEQLKAVVTTTCCRPRCWPPTSPLRMQRRCKAPTSRWAAPAPS